MRAGLVFGALVMRACHGVCTIRTCHSARAMHRTRYNGHRDAAQRRDPRRKKNDGQIDGEESAHHGCESTAIAQGETPVSNPVTRRIRNPTLSSIAVERLRRADPISVNSCG